MAITSSTFETTRSCVRSVRSAARQLRVQRSAACAGPSGYRIGYCELQGGARGDDGEPEYRLIVRCPDAGGEGTGSHPL